MPKKPLAYRGDEPFVFVSYAHADAELAYPIISGLLERGMRIWFDDGLDVGDIWEDVIPDHVEQCAAMLCLISPRFMDSNNCLDEIHYAREQKKELLILHLEDAELSRIFRFRYDRYNADRLSRYSDRSMMLDRLAANPKLHCCLGQVRGATEEAFERGNDCFKARAYGEAAIWFRKAAELGHPEAMRYLGDLFYWGNGVAISYEEAIRWYRPAADKGNAEAMQSLGICYDLGLGVTQSTGDAILWYCLAAENGLANAMRLIGDRYATGKGVLQSYEDAAIWYRRAAEKGYALAMHLLGELYADGKGVPKDQMQAEYWFNKAKQAETGASN